MRLTSSLVLALGLAALGALALWAALGADEIARWAIARQRDFQAEMAGAVRALKAGTPGAWAALVGAAGAYGFVHALGPGHGKYLIGGVGLAGVAPGRLLAVAAASSLLQALWAMALVYGGFWALELGARRMTALAEEVLAPASYLAIGAIGALLAWRGGRTLWRLARPALARPALAAAHHHHHRAECGCGGHGPDPRAVARLGSMRETAALILSVAIRPCTGAIFLLVIAWQMDLAWAGAAAVLAMGLGTAALTSLVALSSVAARGLALGGASQALAVAGPALQLMAGAAILWLSALMLGA